MQAVTLDAYQLLHDGTITLAECEANGLRIDVSYLETKIRETSKQIADMEATLRGDSLYLELRRRFGTKTNIGARQQLGYLVYDVLKHEVTERTKTGKPKMDLEALQALDVPYIQTYLKMEKLKKVKSTYLGGILRETVDGFLHPSFNLNIAITYRSQSELPNFQNIPIRDPEMGSLVRRAFITRKGYQLVETDFSGIEVYVAACYNKDPVLKKYIEDPTTDIHRDMAAQCYKVEPEQVSKQMRYCAKNMFVFPEFYGDWYKSCCQQLWAAIPRMGLEVDGVGLVEHLRTQGIKKLGRCQMDEDPRPGTFEHHIKSVENDFWNNRFKVYTAWKKRAWNEYVRDGGFSMHTGFYCSGVYNRKEVINYRIQGAAFHCLLWSLIEMRKRIRKNKMKAKLVGQIHDSLIADVPKAEVSDYLAMANEVITVALLKAWRWISVPLSIEAEVTPVDGNWFQKKKVEIV